MRFFKVDGIVAAFSFAALFGSNFVASLSESTKNKVYSSMTGGLVQGNEKLFKKLIETPRKHSVLVQFTVLQGSFDCKICHVANNIIKTVAQAWQKTPDSDDLYFVSVDYAKSPSIFQTYKINTAPILYLFPASDTASENPAFLEFKGVGPKMEPEDLVKYLENNLGVKIPYHRPFDYKKYAYYIGMAASGLFMTYLVILRLSVVAFSTKSWASAAMVFILTMISGQMWNSIRGSQYVASNRDGTYEWFAGGFQEQYGLESQVVAVVYGLAAISIVLLGHNVPKIKGPILQTSLSILLIFVFLGCLSFISALFKRKFSHYPYNIYFQ